MEDHLVAGKQEDHKRVTTLLESTHCPKHGMEWEACCLQEVVLELHWKTKDLLATVRREQRETALRDLLMVAKANLKIGPTDALDTGWNLALAEIITALEASANQKEGMNG